MRSLLILAFFVLPLTALAEPVFPPNIPCNGNSSKCGVAIDDDGYIFEVLTGKKIFDVPEPTGALDFNSLYKYGKKYVLESNNYSSAKTSQWISFDYVDGKVFVDKIYYFSIEISERAGPVWYGYECRGNGVVLTEKIKSSFSEQAVGELCGDMEDGVLIGGKTSPHPFIKNSLLVSVPVYRAGSREGQASYIFMGREKPDLLRMACYSGCEAISKSVAVPYVGRIAKSAWFRAVLKIDDCHSSGVYQYADSVETIKINGCVSDGVMALTEYFHDSERKRALFSGVSYGDGYMGDCISQNGDNKKYKYFMFPLAVY